MRLVRSLNSNAINVNVGTVISQIPNIKFYQNKAPVKAQTPYVVFRYDSVLDNSPTYMINLIFACYDDQTKTNIVNNTNADLIQNKFNKKVFNFDDSSIHSMMTIRQEIPNDMLVEKQVVELQFDLVLYEREVI